MRLKVKDVTQSVEWSDIGISSEVIQKEGRLI